MAIEDPFSASTPDYNPSMVLTDEEIIDLIIAAGGTREGLEEEIVPEVDL